MRRSPMVGRRPGRLGVAWLTLTILASACGAPAATPAPTPADPGSTAPLASATPSGPSPASNALDQPSPDLPSPGQTLEPSAPTAVGTYSPTEISSPRDEIYTAPADPLSFTITTEDSTAVTQDIGPEGGTLT